MSRFLLVFGMLSITGTTVAAPPAVDVLGDPLPENAVLRVGTIRPADKIPEDFPQPMSLRGAAMSGDGRTLATFGEPANPGEGRPIQLWDAKTGKQIRTLLGHETSIGDIAISRDGGTVVSTSFNVGSGDGETRIWNAKTGRTERTLPVGGDWVRLHQNGAEFSVVSQNRILVFRTTTGEEVRRFFGPNLLLDLSSDGRFALGTSDKRDTRLRLWDVHHNSQVLHFDGFEGTPRAAVFSPDGRTVAALDGSSKVKIWEADIAWNAVNGQRVPQARLVHELEGHQGRIFSLAFSADGQFLVSGGLDRKLRMWEIATGKEVAAVPAHEKLITVLEASPDGRRFLSGSLDRTVLVWDLQNRFVSSLGTPKWSEESLSKIWEDLAARTSSQAYLAMGLMNADPQTVLADLQQRMESQLIPTKNNRVAELLADLEHSDSLVRHRAMKQLRKLRKVAEPLLIKILQETQSAEVRSRLRFVLAGGGKVARFNESDRLRMRRIIHVMKQHRTPTATAILELLVEECPLPDIAIAAKQVLADR